MLTVLRNQTVNDHGRVPTPFQNLLDGATGPSRRHFRKHLFEQVIVGDQSQSCWARTDWVGRYNEIGPNCRRHGGSPMVGQRGTRNGMRANGPKEMRSNWPT